jgi:proteasome accessory factor B
MLWEAVRDRRPVTFPYRGAGRSEAQQRSLEPWGVVNRRGRWYVAGWDPMRVATRVFRLSRIAGEVRFSGPAGSVTVPDGVDVRAPSTSPSCGSGQAAGSGCAGGLRSGLVPMAGTW